MQVRDRINDTSMSCSTSKSICLPFNIKFSLNISFPQGACRSAFFQSIIPPDGKPALNSVSRIHFVPGALVDLSAT